MPIVICILCFYMASCYFRIFLVGVVFFVGVRKVNKRLKCGML